MTCPSVQVSARTKDHNKTPGAAWKCKHKRLCGDGLGKKKKKKRPRASDITESCFYFILFSFVFQLQSDGVQAVQFAHTGGALCVQWRS